MSKAVIATNPDHAIASTLPRDDIHTAVTMVMGESNNPANAATNGFRIAK